MPDFAHSHQHAPSPAGDEQPFTLERLETVLKGKGLRMTANRRAILRVLIDTQSPLSLEQIQAAGARYVPDGDMPDYATVFRMMILLEEQRLVRKVNLGRAASYYELTDTHHHRDHLVCTDCGQVTPLEGVCPVERLERQIAKKHGFTQLTHSLEFFGLCGQCSGGEK